MKKCPKCEQTKSIDNFGSDRSRANGLNVYCKPCARKLTRESRGTDSEVIIPRELKIRISKRASKVRNLGIDLVDIDSSRISGYEDIEFARNYIDSL